MIIDCHGHYTTAPGELQAFRDAQVAASSGHKLLDEAAVKAAMAMGRLPETGAREVLLPVVFRLR